MALVSAGWVHGECCREDKKTDVLYHVWTASTKMDSASTKKDWTMEPSTQGHILSWEQGLKKTELWEAQRTEYLHCSFISSRNKTFSNNSIGMWIVYRHGDLKLLLGEAAKGMSLFVTWKSGMSWRKTKRRKMVTAKRKMLCSEGWEHLQRVCSWLRSMFRQGPHWEGSDAFGAFCLAPRDGMVLRRELLSWMSANTSLPGREIWAGAGIHRKWFMPCNLCKK